MNNAFSSNFDNNRDSFAKTISHLLILFKQDYDWVIFVEGNDDLTLFEKIYFKMHPQKKVKLIPVYSKANLKNVIDKFEFGHVQIDLVDKIFSMKRMVLLDADYDKLFGIELVDKEYVEKYNLKYLPVHSLENYFFLDNNLHTITKILNLKDADYELLIKYRNIFHLFIKNYEICNIIKTESHLKNLSIKLNSLPSIKDLDYNKIFLTNDTFSFDPLTEKAVKESLLIVDQFYPKESKVFFDNYISNISKIRGKLFRKLLYEYLVYFRVFKLPDFKNLFEFYELLEIDLPTLE